MADITDLNDQGSPLDDHVNGLAGGDSRPSLKRQRPSNAGDDDDDDDDKPGRERRKIEIKFITDKSRRHITFSKRKAGIMKKAYELSVLTGTQVLLLVVSETGLVYTFTTPKLQPLVTKPEGKNLIQVSRPPDGYIASLNIPQTCLNAPEPASAGDNGLDDSNIPESPEDSAPQHIPQQQQRNAMPQNVQMHPAYGMPNQLDASQQQAIAYQQYVQSQQRQGGGYPMPSGGMSQHSHQP